MFILSLSLKKVNNFYYRENNAIIKDKNSIREARANVIIFKIQN